MARKKIGGGQGPGGWAWPALGLLTCLLSGAAAWLSQDLPGRLRTHLGVLLLAGLCWMASAAIVARSQPPRRAMGWLLSIAILVRLPGWLLPPRHSDDHHRYLWDGEVGRRGISPYMGPPDDPIYAEVRAARPALHAAINNRHLPTIYPPTLQLGFRAGVALGGLWGWKGVVAVADLLTLGLLVGLCRRRGQDPRWAALWGWSPLCGLELAQNAHTEALALAPCVAALLLWGRPLACGALWGVALLAKPLAAVLLPAVLRRPRRGRFLVGTTLAALLLLAPHLGAGARVLGSLGEYGRRWRANDGAFALLHGAAEAVVRRLYPQPHHEPWAWRTLARIITGRDRDTVFPDELAALLARAGAAAILLALGFSLVRGPLCRLGPAEGALVLTGACLLLTPVLHPWYLLWALALCPLWPAAAPPVLVLCALAPLAYLPLLGWLTGGGWHEPTWARILQHGAAWGTLALVVGSRSFDAAIATKYIKSIP